MTGAAIRSSSAAPAGAPTPDQQRTRAPYLLSGPALAIFALLFLVPVAMTLVLSFHSYSSTAGIVPTLTLSNYAEAMGDSYFHEIFLRTFTIAVVTTAICAVIGVPEAYVLFHLDGPWRSFCLLAVLGPLLISVVVRTLGWTILLGNNGIINSALLASGLIGSPMEFLFTKTGVVIALVHVFVPYMVLAVLVALQRVDPATVHAAQSLGAARSTAFLRIVLPQIMPGILSGSLIVFSLAASAFATPAIIGGRRTKVVATTVYDEYLSTLNWPLGAAIAMLLLIATLAIMWLWNRIIERRYAQVFG